MDLTPVVRSAPDSSVLCWLTTGDDFGRPSVSPKEIFTRVGDDVLIAHIASPRSVRNIEANENVCLNVLDVFEQSGYRAGGTRGPRSSVARGARRRFERERAVAVAKSRLDERRRRLRLLYDSGGELPPSAIAVALEAIRQVREATGEGPAWGHIGSLLGHRAPPAVEAIMFELTALGLVQHTPRRRSLDLTDSGRLWLEAQEAR